jgi:2-oxo-4-hydroxy-4-carboxy-5-ureidoimidazoline decarboxylase
VKIARLDELPPEKAREAFERCCGAARWVEAMVDGRPYRSPEALYMAAEREMEALRPEDWLEAFRHHPRIGDVASLREKFASTAAWAGAEQSGAATATEETLEALAQGNRDYEQRFGYIFIVSATGKSAGQMLEILKSRLTNPPEDELSVAAGEQRKITRIRLAKLLEGNR